MQAGRGARLASGRGRLARTRARRHLRPAYGVYNAVVEPLVLLGAVRHFHPEGESHRVAQRSFVRAGRQPPKAFQGHDEEMEQAACQKAPPRVTSRRRRPLLFLAAQPVRTSAPREGQRCGHSVVCPRQGPPGVRVRRHRREPAPRDLQRHWVRVSGRHRRPRWRQRLSAGRRPESVRAGAVDRAVPPGPLVARLPPAVGAGRPTHELRPDRHAVHRAEICRDVLRQ